MQTNVRRVFRSCLCCIAALVSSALCCQPLNAQCYIDPLSGRRVCSQPTYGWRPVSGPSANSSSPIHNSPAPRATAHCRINVSDGSAGSGTLIARDESVGLVLTCAHLFDDAADRIVVTFPNGQRFGARLIDRDRPHDLAALVIRRPEIEPLSVDDAAATGPLTACGFGPNGQFRCIRGDVTGQATAVGATFPSMTIRGAVRPGDSGGAVLNVAGLLVGVVWGQRDGLTYATCGQPLREFLNRVRGQGSSVEGREPEIAGRDPDSRLAAFDSRLTAVEARVATCETNQQDKGDYLRHDDLAGYARIDQLPKFDDQRFAKRADVEERIGVLATSVEAIRSRVEEAVAIRTGVFADLSFGKLLVGALGLSGPLAAAGLLAAAFARRSIRSRVGGQGSTTGEAPAPDSRTATFDAVRVAVDSPAPPQRTVPETHYVSVEKDSFAKAHQWASEQVARKYPGATEVLQAQGSLIKQYMAAQ